MLRIKLVKSPIGQNPKNRATTQALGLRKISQVIEKEDTPSVRGMVHAIHHMLQVWDGETLIHDGTKVRKKATRKGRKPSEKRGADK
ncbi:50S ribosomal protein L30 [bacterium]|nr:MAG: 50S ribosomal protein L30 [bacterium]